MKVFVCKNKDCNTVDPCMLFVEDKAAEPTVCPFDCAIEDHLIPEWETINMVTKSWSIRWAPVPSSLTSGSGRRI